MVDLSPTNEKLRYRPASGSCNSADGSLLANIDADHFIVVANKQVSVGE